MVGGILFLSEWFGLSDIFLLKLKKICFFLSPVFGKVVLLIKAVNDEVWK